MTFRKAADGVAAKGKTKGKNLGDSGPTVSIKDGGKSSKGGKTDADMLKLGRGLAKIANQKRG
jgi:hypothetical protein